uniref:TerD family protein n=1 Tax=Bacillus thuringiensis TaxID=1428 RepID=UPI0037C15676
GGDDERILVELDKVRRGINGLVLVVNIYECVNGGQDLGMIGNGYIGIEKRESGEELGGYKL